MVKTKFEDVMMAYADCNNFYDSDHENMRGRNLDFRSKDWVTPNVAIEIMNKAVPNGYNEFDTNTFEYFNQFSDCKLQIARESSVCVYVRGLPVGTEVKDVMLALHADECTWDMEVNAAFPGDDCVVRVWWD